jgi:hypothetical protein
MNNFSQTVSHTDIFTHFLKVHNAVAHWLAGILTLCEIFHCYPHLPIYVFGFMFPMLLILLFYNHTVHSYVHHNGTAEFCAAIKYKI